MKRGVLIFWAAIIAVVAIGIGSTFFLSKQPGQLDGFATCLKERGAVFYGAFWCPHCQATKSMFGRSAKLLPYVECSTPDGKSQVQACTDVGITNYPTWIFSDGTKKVGELSLQQLSDLTGCEVPRS